MNSVLLYGLKCHGIAASDHRSAVNVLICWCVEQDAFASVEAPGHSVVHGVKHIRPEVVTQDLLDERHHIGLHDPDHPPREIELIKELRIIRADEELMIPRSVTRLLGLGYLKKAES